MTTPTLMTTHKAIVIVEGFEDEDSDEELVEAWQHLIDTGTVWRLQSLCGRTAADLIRNGVCVNPPDRILN